MSSAPLRRIVSTGCFSLSLLGLAFGAGAAASTGGLNAELAVASKTTPTDARARIAEQYGRLPIRFEANRGQTDATVKFVSRGPGYALFLTADEAVVTLREPQAAKTPVAAPTEATAPPAAPKTSVLRWQLVGANPKARVAGEQPLPGHSNYLVGNDAKQWHTGVEHYAQVRYQQVYPGIDLIYHGSQQQLEYDFIVAPGADPNLLRLRYSGQQQLTLNAQGDLVLTTAVGDLVQHKPVLYQILDGERRRVDGRFALKSSGDSTEVAFTVAAYDRSQPLVIDPALAYSTYLGGSGDDYGYGIAVDNSGNAYVTGTTYSANFPLTNAQDAGKGGTNDAFVTKLDASGATLLYSTYLGGSNSDYGTGIAVDGAGNAYVAGYTYSTDFPVAAALQGTPGGAVDVFVTKLDASGSALLYSTYLGGSGSDYSGTGGIAVDSAGNAYLTGQTSSANFPVANTLQKSFGGGYYDAFVAKLTASGSALAYSTYLGGSSGDYGTDIAVDSAGKAYVTGVTSSADFPLASALQGVFGGGTSDAFVAKLNAAGSKLTYSTYLGGTGSDAGNGIAIDSAGNAYMTGFTYSTNFPLANALQGSIGGGGSSLADVFVSKLAASGSTLAYSTYLGGSNNDFGNDIGIDSAGNAYVTGLTYSSNFPLADALQDTTGGTAGFSDAFVAKLTAGGGTLAYSTYLGGGGNDYGNDIAVDSVGSAYVTGYTTATDFPHIGAFQGVAGGKSDAFISKIDGSSVADTTPDSFTFTDVQDLAPKTTVTSQALPLTGFSPPLPVSIGGGSYRINGGAWTSATRSISPGDTVQLRATAPATSSATLTVSFTAGAVTDSWTVSTAPDSIPNPFVFPPKLGVAQAIWVSSNAVTPNGYDTPTAVSVSGGQYRISIDGVWGDWTSAAGTLSPTQKVQLRVRSASAPDTTTQATLTVGGVSATFSVTTAP